jgi:hypothetical protein
MGATTPKDRAKNWTKTQEHVQHSMQEKWQKYIADGTEPGT